MFLARLICSDTGCAQRDVADAETLAELDALACECGCAYQVLGVPDWIEEDDIVVALRRPRPAPLPPRPVPHAA